MQAVLGLLNPVILRKIKLVSLHIHHFIKSINHQGRCQWWASAILCLFWAPAILCSRAHVYHCLDLCSSHIVITSLTSVIPHPIVSLPQCVFHERVKCFRSWKDAEMNLTKKREMRAKLELARKMDKIPAVNQDITLVS